MRVPAASHGSFEIRWLPETVPLFLFSYFSAVRLVDTPHGLCLSLFAKVTITATLVPSLITAWTPRTCDGLMMARPQGSDAAAQEHRCTDSPLQKKAAASRLIAPTAQ